MSDKTLFFSWSEPIPVTGPMLLEFLECAYNGQYYELPFSIDAHAKYYYSLLYIRSALQAKVNILSSCYQPHPLFPRQAFAQLAMDYLWFGNAYLEKSVARTGKLLALRPSPAKFTRRDKDNRYKFISNGDGILHGYTVHDFPPGAVLHLLEPDVNQELYGVPEWLPAIQAALLNEAATNFRLRYYQNGSHAGYILYLTDANINEDDIKNLEDELKASKGPGNFRNLLLYSPNGNKDGIQLLPISEVAAKDEFMNIKAVSRDDQLAACRVPPNLIGIVPTNSSGFGSITDAAKIFARNEVQPLQERFTQINAWLGEEIVRFIPYDIGETTDSKA